MCLSYVRESFNGDEPESQVNGIAYKIFVRRRRRLYGLFRSPSGGSYSDKMRVGYKVKQPYTITDETDGKIYASYSSYRKGFHCFVTRADAQKYLNSKNAYICMKNGDKAVILRVEYSDLTARGTDEGCEAIVARNITILRHSKADKE